MNPIASGLHFIPRPVHNCPLLIQIPAVHDTPLRLGVIIVLLRRLNHSRRSVNSQDGSNYRQKTSRELAITTTHIENLVRRLRGQVAEKLLGELGDERCRG